MASTAARIQAQRRWRRRNPDYYRERRHGITLAEKAVMLEAQGGRCYLCGEDLLLEAAYVDHDHRCCPRLRSCRYCRRGLAHSECNLIVGNAGDDPGRLERIAASLRAALPLVDQRLAVKRASEPTLFSEADIAG